MSDPVSHLEQLSPAQRQAVEHAAGPLIVLAGPGTGKTRVITHRIAHLVGERGVEPESIVAVTFTVKAAEQMRERLRELIGSAKADRVWASTFHAMGLRILQRFGDTLRPTADEPAIRLAEKIAADVRARAARGGGGWASGGGFVAGNLKLVDSAQRKRLLRRIIAGLDVFRSSRAYGLDAAAEIAATQIDKWGEMAVFPETAAAFASQWAGLLSDGKGSDGQEPDEQGLAAERERLGVFRDGVRVYEVYESALRVLGLASFSDLINLPIRLLNDASSRAGAILRSEWRHVVVDEFQDANPAQIELLRGVVPPSDVHPPDLCVVGDDDQSIYGFRGADDRAFTRMAFLWGSGASGGAAGGGGVRVIELSENYRSTRAIVSVASELIARAHSRFKPDKRIVAAGKNAEPPRGGGRAEASIPSGVLAVGLDHEGQDAQAIAAMVRLHLHGVRGSAESVAEDSAAASAGAPSFAVVVRSNSHVSPIASALREEGLSVRTAFVPRAAGDPGVQDVLAWCRLLIDPSATVQARRILARPPLRWPAETLSRLERMFLAAREEGDAAAAGEGGFLAFLLSQPEDELGPGGVVAVKRLAELHERLSARAATEQASKTLREIVSATDVAHSELLSAADRAERVRALVALLGFAGDVQTRLEEPGDLRALLEYYDDLSPEDQGLGSSGVWGDIEERLDGPAEGERPGEGDEHAEGGAGAASGSAIVTILTAHKAKGLEFDVVFAPRAGKTKGHYSFAGKDDEAELAGNGVVPAGLMGFAHPGERSSAQAGERAEDEARRIFYVACTRARQRLVVLAKRLKSKSKSGANFFQELEFGDVGRGVVEQSGFEEIMRAAVREKVLRSVSAAIDPSEGAPALYASADGAAAEQVLDRARRDVRLEAAQLLDRCEQIGMEMEGSNDAGEIRALEEELGRVAARMRAIGVLARPGGNPPGALAQLAGSGGDPFVQRLSARVAAARSAEAAAEEGDELLLPGLKPPLKLSYTQINEYLRCPRCYYYTNVLGMPEEEGEPKIVGQVVHKAIELFTRRARGMEADAFELASFGIEDADVAATGGIGPGLDELLAIGRGVFRKRWPAGEPIDREQVEQLEILLRNFHEVFWRAEDHTLELERSVLLPYQVVGSQREGAHTIRAVIDRVDQIPVESGGGAFRIVDYKTGQKWKSLAEPAKDDLQMGIYAMALAHDLGIKPEELRGVAEYWLVAGRTRGVLNLQEIRLDKVRSRIDEAIEGMLAGRFPIGKDHLSGRHGEQPCLLFEASGREPA